MNFILHCRFNEILLLAIVPEKINPIFKVLSKV